MQEILLFVFVIFPFPSRGYLPTTPVSCPDGVADPALMECYQITISAPNTADINATYAVADDGMRDGTMVLFSGSGGTSFFKKGFVELFYYQGKRVAQVAYDTDWEDTGLEVKNIKSAGGRPPTVLKHLYETVHMSNFDEPFGVFGHSGGSAQVAYSLAHYGMADYLDCAMMSSGPVFGNIQEGCNKDFNGAVEVCSDEQFGCEQQEEQHVFSPKVIYS